MSDHPYAWGIPRLCPCCQRDVVDLLVEGKSAATYLWGITLDSNGSILECMAGTPVEHKTRYEAALAKLIAKGMSYYDGVSRDIDYIRKRARTSRNEDMPPGVVVP